MKMKLSLTLFTVVLTCLCSAQGLDRNLLNRFNGRRNQGAQRADSSAAGNGAVANPSIPSNAQPGASKVDAGGRDIEFNGAALDLVLQVYGNLVNKTILKDPAAPSAQITLQPRQGQELSDEDKISAIETVLEMNGIHLEPYGDKFMRALPRKDARKEGIPLILDPDTILGDTTKTVSFMIYFKHIAIDEAQKALEGFKSNNGVLLVYERTNSILVTDTETNINRMREIATAIDVETPVNENVFVRQIQNANAEDIKTALEAIVQDSQQEQEKSKAPKNAVTPTATPVQPNRLGDRLKRSEQPSTPNNPALVTSVSDADRGMIRGKVLILSDERSNKLIVVTSKINMDFFDKVIEQLDIETTPDTVVKVYRLKYADAEDVSDMINDLIGNAQSSKNSSKSNQNQAAKGGTAKKSNLSSNTATANTPKKSANQRSGEAKAGELSKDNTTVLADKRINGLVVMTDKSLVPVLEQIIDAMDVKLAQVLIETVIVEVNLEDSIKTGIDWVHQLHMSNADVKSALMGGGGSTSSAGTLADIAENGVALGSVPATGGLSYYALANKLDLGVIIEASKTDTRTKYLASPVIMTVDNKEAKIEATQMRYLLTGFTSSGTSYSTIAVPNYEQKELGITITTTPKINPNGTVMLEVEEEYSQIGAAQNIQTAGGLGTSGSGSSSNGLITVSVDTTVTRKLSADISLENRQTVILGGLTETTVTQKETGIPILKDIPWIGRYLFGSTTDSETRKELLVFMTPYVLDDAEAAQAEALRRKNALSDYHAWEDNGWSQSKLADPVSVKEQLRRQKDEWERQDKEYEAAKDLEKQRKERIEVLKERAEESAVFLDALKDEAK